jgi:hypothetical protein
MSGKKFPPEEEPSGIPPHREITLRVLLETFDLYVQSVAEITAETGLPSVTVEILMAYCLALPAADELIYGFIRGDQALFPDPIRDLLARDTRRLELEPPAPAHEDGPRTPLARRLGTHADATRRGAGSEESELNQYIRKNPEIARQVEGSPKPFLARWVMLHLMERAQARERGRRVVHEFLAGHPEFSERLRALAMGTPIGQKRISPRH